MASLPLIVKYLIVFVISMVPIVELRGAIPIAESLGLNIALYYPIAIIGNMLPVPVIYLFARKVLEWGKDKKLTKKFFTWCLEKGEKGGEKLKKALTPICQVTEKIMYENNRKILSEIPEMKDIRSVSFTCASSARRFFDQIGEEKQQWIENILCISIGEKTTKQLREIGVRHILESKDTTYVSMFYKIKESML